MKKKLVEDLTSTPNLISYSRVIMLIPIILLYNNRILMFVLFLVAALSDAVDGYIARKQGSNTVIGEVIDPVCDKLLFAGVIFLFFFKQDINLFALLVFLLRDLFMIALTGITFLLALLDSKALHLKDIAKARFKGKVTTLLVVIGVLWIIAGIPYFEYFIFTILVSSVIAIIDYSIEYGKKMSRLF